VDCHGGVEQRLWGFRCAKKLSAGSLDPAANIIGARVPVPLRWGTRTRRSSEPIDFFEYSTDTNYYYATACDHRHEQGYLGCRSAICTYSIAILLLDLFGRIKRGSTICFATDSD
jgi:hypothetical protein